MQVELLIRQTELFRGLQPSSRKALAAICLRKTLGKRDILFMEGARGQALFLLETGVVQLHKTSREGREVIIRVIKPGEIFAEVVLFEEDRYPVTAIALVPSVAILIPKRDFHALLAREDFRNDFIRALLQKQRVLARRILELTAQDVETRLFSFFEEHYGRQEKFTADLSKKDLAAVIGATPETLSRLLLKLKKEGTLDWRGKEIRLRKNFWRQEPE
jgi:CRP/FNR family transcriptional regulator